MMRTRKMTVMATVSAVVLAASVAAAGGVEVGSKAPDFTLQDHQGNEVSLSDFDGAVRVLEWTNPDCPFVVRHYEAGTMKKLAEQYAGKKVVWLTVNSTHYMDAEANAAFAKKYGIKVPILVDQDGTVGTMYGAKTTPHMFVIDPDGKVVYAGAIDSDPRGNAEAPTNYVDAALEAAVAGKAVQNAETTPYGCSVKYKKSS